MKQPQNAFPANLWRSFFYSPVASVVTIGLFLLIGAAGWYAWKWGVADAIFRADFKACMNNHDGACWGFVAEKWRLILFGRFPYDEQWRAAAATGGVILMLVISAFPQLWNRTGCKILTAGWILALGAFFVLMLDLRRMVQTGTAGIRNRRRRLPLAGIFSALDRTDILYLFVYRRNYPSRCISRAERTVACR
uniref:hypothetical protein n=1 Tax=Parasutterella excrementihominis TaxID=487175 RepID=UPI003FEF4FE7